ncbi:anhydro-N-acetylmuramic acid kinase [bacterium]|nr:anhydro-N-acetylmuramic acid kinase [bacterium]
MDLLERYRSLENPRIIGLMSGTSVDAIDAALVEIKPKLRLLRLASLDLPDKVRRRLHDFFKNKADTADLLKMHWLFGDLLARAAQKAMGEPGTEGYIKADLIASHGQTVFHLPQEEDYLGFKVRGTLQLGEGAVIAEKTQCLTVCDFRPQDLASGGQGAPLVPFVDKTVFYSPDCDRIALNIGGMANITWIPKDRNALCLACDTGPGNVLMDRLAEIYLHESCDRDGALAMRGKVIEELLAELMQHPFLRKSWPKSTGREEFGEEMAEGLYERALANGWPIEDLMRTLAAFTAASISMHIKSAAKGKVEIVTGGGGVNNKAVMLELRRCMGEQAEFLSMESLGVPAQAREAMAFAVLGHCCAMGVPCNLPSATGAGRDCVLGKIVLP